MKHQAPVIAIILVALVASSAGVVGLHDAPPLEDPAFTYEWRAPENATGAFLTRARVDFPGGGSNKCDITGTTAIHTSDTRALYALDTIQDRGGVEAAGVTYEDRLYQAHVDGVVDTRRWEMTDYFFTTVTRARQMYDGYVEVTLVGFNTVGYKDNPDEAASVPMSLNITCAGPATLTVHQVGRHVHGFTAESAEGGAGATVHESTVNVADGVQDRFGNDSVVLRAFSFWGYPGTAVNNVVLDHPNGTRAWAGVDLTWPVVSVPATFEGPPGRYDLRVNRAGLAARSSLTLGEVFAAAIGDVDDVVRNGTIQDPPDGQVDLP